MPDIQVFDNLVPLENLAAVRTSALAGGFGRWQPASHAVGSGIYDGMGFMGKHDVLVRAIAYRLQRPIFPASMFFRVTNAETEKAYVHSDRESGAWTAVVYLSDHKEEVSGTGFFRHRRTGWREMPSLETLHKGGVLKRMSKEMVDGSDKIWEQLDFVRGILNRALVFRAPLFHVRCPKTGFGKTSEDGRLIWACHFFLE